ncbi:MAG TPA: FAD-dependent monooxygenase [Xanthobacteraceae bacterium]|nr:FAD-dependent monooxygenase [Xanthobacteraceae bacterium]
MGDLTIAIVGGGIGGVAAALSLAKAGLDAHVYEQAPALREVGAGIVLSPNATRILDRLGLGAALAQTSVRPLAWHERRWDDGRTLLRVPLADAALGAFGFPYYQCHRADVQTMLARALPAARLHLGHRLVGLNERGDRVEAQFDNGARVQADVVVGADGIHSAVRHALFGPDNPRFTGCVAYRGLVPAARVAHLDLETTMQRWMGPGKHFVHYYVQARRLLNFVCLVEQDAWTSESWTARGDVMAARAAYRGWHPQVRAILDAQEEIFIWALLDRAPLPRWSVGRVTLLGDACHPMLPFMAQGAAQAIEDGATLAAILARHGTDVTAALRAYEVARLARTSRIQGLAITSKTRLHLPDGPAQEERDAQMANNAADWTLAQNAWIYGHDAGAV